MQVLVYCPLTSRQKDLYRHIVEKTIADFLTNEEEKPDEVLPEKRRKQVVDYSAFLDDKECADDDKFEEQLVKMQDYTQSIAKSTGSAYNKEMDRLKGNEKNFSVKSRMMDMRKAVNHPYLIEYPVSECGTFYDATDDMVGAHQIFTTFRILSISPLHPNIRWTSAASWPSSTRC